MVSKWHEEEDANVHCCPFARFEWLRGVHGKRMMFGIGLAVLLGLVVTTTWFLKPSTCNTKSPECVLWWINLCAAYGTFSSLAYMVILAIKTIVQLHRERLTPVTHETTVNYAVQGKNNTKENVDSTPPVNVPEKSLTDFNPSVAYIKHDLVHVWAKLKEAFPDAVVSFDTSITQVSIYRSKDPVKPYTLMDTSGPVTYSFSQQQIVDICLDAIS
jgi:hypothetical protein